MSEYYFLGLQRKPCRTCAGIMGITEVESPRSRLWKCARCGYSEIEYLTSPLGEDEIRSLRDSRTDGPFSGDDSAAADARRAANMDEFLSIMQGGQRKRWWQIAMMRARSRWFQRRLRNPEAQGSPVPQLNWPAVEEVVKDLKRANAEKARALMVDPASAQAVMDAAMWGPVSKVEALISAEPALVNFKDSLDETPLHRAAGSAGLVVDANMIARLLIAKGADVTAKDHYGNTPLHQAAGARDVEIATMLIDHGAEVRARNDVGHEPVHGAKDCEMIELLLSRGADINARSNRGETPLAVVLRVRGEDWLASFIRGKGGVYSGPQNSDHALS